MIKKRQQQSEFQLPQAAHVKLPTLRDFTYNLNRTVIFEINGLYVKGSRGSNINVKLGKVIFSDRASLTRFMHLVTEDIFRIDQSWRPTDMNPELVSILKRENINVRYVYL